MKKSTKISLLVGGIVIVLIGVIGITFAFFSTGGKQETANTFTSGCLNISLTDASASISLSNIYPVTDIEGLDTTSYDFTITNTCNTDANYEINLESLNQVSNSLSADYLKVSLSSDTVGNVISILSDNTSVTPEIDNAYEAYNLYTGTLKASETKTYHLKLWLDYDATVEVAANKVYQSKINVVANPEIQVVDTQEATFELNDKTLTSNLTSNVTNATYCTTTDNICTPNTSANISNNSYTVELERNENNQMVCTKLNGTSKIICSNIIEGVQLCPEGATVCNTILANTELKTDKPDFSKTAQAFCSDTSTCEETNGIYEETTSKGTTYYFRGAVDNNWVKFGDFYWRIIRINEDGSLRLIYSGDGSAQTTGTGTQTEKSTFSINSSTYNNNAYVGYMYTVGSLRGTTTDSGIKKKLDTWYQNNLSSYADKIDGNAGFCGDRTPSTSSSSTNNQGGTGTTKTYYGGYIRSIPNKQLTFECPDGDLYTTKGSEDGNKALQYPIGLITVDEVAYAGGVGGTSNSSYYLYTNSTYWTMSPFDFNDNLDAARVFSVNLNGGRYGDLVRSEYGVRPVINLKADVQITGGDGTADNPYIIGNNISQPSFTIEGYGTFYFEEGMTWAEWVSSSYCTDNFDTEGNGSVIFTPDYFIVSYNDAYVLGDEEIINGAVYIPANWE